MSSLDPQNQLNPGVSWKGTLADLTPDLPNQENSLFFTKPSGEQIKHSTQFEYV